MRSIGMALFILIASSLSVQADGIGATAGLPTRSAAAAIRALPLGGEPEGRTKASAEPVLDIETRGRRFHRYPEPRRVNRGGYTQCRILECRSLSVICEGKRYACRYVRYGCVEPSRDGNGLPVMYVEVSGPACCVISLR